MLSIEEKIKNLRELKNFTQEYMAEKLGVTQAAYSKIENGTNNIKFSIDSVVNCPSSYNPHPPKSFPSGSNQISRFKTVRSNIIAV